MSASVNQKQLEGAESLLKHLAGGGALKSAAGIGNQEMEAIYAVAYNHFNSGKLDKASDLFKLLCLYDHTEPRWFTGLGTIRQAARDYQGAVEAYSVATLLDMDDPRPQTQAGYCLMALERWPEAESALEGAILTCDSAAPRFDEVRKQAESLLATARAKKDGKAGKD
jgi:type III secretion system low calcium response chaperone LcrH/SycD